MLEKIRQLMIIIFWSKFIFMAMKSFMIKLNTYTSLFINTWTVDNVTDLYANDIPEELQDPDNNKKAKHNMLLIELIIIFLILYINNINYLMDLVILY